MGTELMKLELEKPVKSTGDWNVPVNENFQRIMDYAAAVNAQMDNKAGENIFINGSIDFWQRGTYFQVPINHVIYAMDRFVVQNTGAANIIAEQSTDVPDSKSKYSAKITANHGLWFIGQRIEHASGLNAFDNVTISCFIKGNSGATFMTIDNKQYTCNGTWQKIKVTIATGNFNDGYTFIVISGTGIGGGGTYYIAQIKLEIGDKATPSVPRPYAMELALCQRYYEKSYPSAISPGWPSIEGAIVANPIIWGGLGRYLPGVRFNAEKRVAPSVRIFGTAGTENKVGILASPDADNELTPVEFMGTSGFPFIESKNMDLGINQAYAYNWVADAEIY